MRRQPKAALPNRLGVAGCCGQDSFRNTLKYNDNTNQYGAARFLRVLAAGEQNRDISDCGCDSPIFLCAPRRIQWQELTITKTLQTWNVTKICLLGKECKRISRKISHSSLRPTKLTSNCITKLSQYSAIAAKLLWATQEVVSFRAITGMAPTLLGA